VNALERRRDESSRATGDDPDPAATLGDLALRTENHLNAPGVVVRPDDDTEIYRAVEAAKGELGIYIRADGTDKPARFEIRGASFSHLQALPVIAEGEYVPDLIATLGSLDTIMGEVDR
jgi:NADH:ubiquinone oxidoreductase subunit D